MALIHYPNSVFLCFYAADLGSNATPTSVSVATTVTPVSDYATPASSLVADAAPTPAPVENVPTPNIRPARERMSNATPNSVLVADAAPTTTPVVNVSTPAVQRAQKRMVVGMRVSGMHGEYAVPQVNDKGKRRRCKTQIYE